MLINGGYFVIRSISESDIGDIYAVYQQCEDFLALGPVSTASRQMVLEDLQLSREEGGVFCGIFTGGEMAGIVDFVPDHYRGNPVDAYLTLLMIAARHRGKGLGCDVVEAVEAEIRKNRDVHAIYAGVQVNNDPAVSFWQRRGYQITGGPERMPDTTIVYHLRKDLPKTLQQTGI